MAMSFPCTPCELVLFTAEKLSFSGIRGLSLDELWLLIQNKFDQKEALDDFQKQIIWQCLFFDYNDEKDDEIESSSNSPSNANEKSIQFYMSMNGDPVPIQFSFNNFMTSKKSNDLRILPTVDTQCYYLTGSSNIKRTIQSIGEFPYALLQEISKHGANGIYSPELCKATSQDPRSLTGRLNKLEEMGLIYRENKYFKIRKCHTSWMTHMKFSGVSTKEENSELYLKSPRALKEYIVNAVKNAPNQIRAFRDLKLELNMATKNYGSRLFGCVVYSLNRDGYIERVDAIATHKDSGKEHKVYSLKFKKDLPKNLQDDSLDLFNLLEDNEELNMDEDDDDYEEEIEDKDNLLPRWSIYFPMATQIYQVIVNSGKEGSTIKELIQTLCGNPKHRIVERFMDVITSYSSKNNKLEPLQSFPDEDENLSIIKLPLSDGKLKYFRYYSKSNFDKYQSINSFKKKLPPKKVILNTNLAELNKKSNIKLDKQPSKILYHVPNDQILVPYRNTRDSDMKSRDNSSISSTNFNQETNRDEESCDTQKILKKRDEEAIATDPGDIEAADVGKRKRKIETNSRADNSRRNPKRSRNHIIKEEDTGLQINNGADDYHGDPDLVMINDQLEEKTDVSDKCKFESYSELENDEEFTGRRTLEEPSLVQSFVPKTKRLNNEYVTKRGNATFREESFDETGDKRRSAIIQLVNEEGGVAFTCAAFRRSIDSKLNVQTFTDIKTLRRDVKKLEQAGKLKVETIKMIKSGQNVIRQLMISTDDMFRPSKEEIDYKRSLCVADVGAKSSTQNTQRRVVKEEITLYKLQSIFPKRLLSLSSTNGRSKFSNKEKSKNLNQRISSKKLTNSQSQNSFDISSHKMELQKELEDLSYSEKVPVINKKSASVRRSRQNLFRKSRKFDKNDVTTLFRAVCISKSFNNGLIDYQAIANLYKKDDAISTKKSWIRVRKQIGGSTKVKKGIETFENIVLQAVELDLISVADLENVNLGFYLNVWNHLDDSTIAIVDKMPLYSNKAQNMKFYDRNYNEMQNPQDLYEQLDTISMKQKEGLLGCTHFFYKPDEDYQFECKKFQDLRTVLGAILGTSKQSLSNSQQVKKILGDYQESDVKLAIKEMIKDKELIYFNSADSEEFRLTDKIYHCLDVRTKKSFFKEASQFESILKQIISDAKGLLISQAIDGGKVSQLLNCISSRVLWMIRIDKNYTFEGYESRQMSKEFLDCELIVYEKSNDAYFCDIPVNNSAVPTGLPCSHIWLDINGEIDSALWSNIIAAVLHYVQFRPGIPEHVLYNKFVSLLSYKDFKDVVNWLFKNKAVQRKEFSGISTDKNYLTVLGH